MDGATPTLLRFGPFELDMARQRLRREGDEVVMQPRPFEVLVYLVTHAGALVTADDLREAVWQQVVLSDESLKQTIRKLRGALGDSAREPRYVATVHRRGYRFIAPLETATAEAGRAATPQPRDPPPTSRDFIGRDDVLAALREHLDAGQRLVVLHGFGGMGKTRTALHVAGLEAARWPDGVRFVDLAPIGDADGLLGSTAQALTVPLSDATREGAVVTLGRAMDALGDALVIFDNAEHVTDTLAPYLRDWHSAAPGVTFLVTSRAPLGLQAEVHVPMGPLADEEAAALFRRRSTRTGDDPATEAAVHTLVRRLDGNPLAIELAAARGAVMSPQDMLARIDDRFRLLRDTTGDRPRRHLSLREAIDWSWERLEAPAQSALAQCAVFASDFDLDRAEEVIDLSDHRDAPWVVDLLQDLVARCLLRARTAADGRRRLSMLDSVHAYACERLEAHPKVAAVRSRHRDQTLTRAEAAMEAVWQTDGPEGRGRLSGLLADLLAIYQTTRAEDPPAAARAALGAVATLGRTGPLHLAERLLGDLDDPALAALPPALEARWHLARAHVRGRLRGQPEATQADLEQAAALAERAGDDGLRGRAEAALGEHLRGQGAMAEALSLADRVHARAKAAGDGRLQAEACRLRAGAHRVLGAREASRDAGREGLALCERLEHRPLRAELLTDIAELELLEGRPEQAAARYEEALDLLTGAGAADREVAVRNNLGNLLGRLGRVEEADACFERAMALAHDLGDLRKEAVLTLNAGLVDLFGDTLDLAQRRTERALGLCEQMGLDAIAAIAVGNLGTLAWLRGDLDTAARRFGLAMASQAGAGEVGQGLGLRAEVAALAADRDDIAGAEDALEDAKGHADDARPIDRQRLALAEAHLHLARARAADGDDADGHRRAAAAGREDVLREAGDDLDQHVALSLRLLDRALEAAGA